MNASIPPASWRATEAPVCDESVSHDEDRSLLERVADGDRTALHAIHEKHKRILFSAIYKVLNNQQDAEDVYQELLAQIWKKASLYSAGRGKPLTWISTMARNRAIDRLRNKQRRARLSEEFGQERYTLYRADDQTSADALDVKERGEVVRSAILELSDEQREAIELAYFSGLTQNEIASQLGQPLGTVKARIRRGIVKLRGVVAPQLNS